MRELSYYRDRTQMRSARENTLIGGWRLIHLSAFSIDDEYSAGVVR